MSRRRIAVCIRPDGSIEAETLGITGDACLDYLPLLEDLLDAEVANSAFTSDYGQDRLAAAEATHETGATATETVSDHRDA